MEKAESNENDLIIGSEENALEGPFTDDDIVWDETTACQYVDTAIVCLANIETLDLASFTEVERGYIKKTKKMCVRIMHNYIKDIYTDMINIEKEEE